MRTVGAKELLLLGAYALLYVVTRELSVSHWLLSSGLRFIALLFLPFRYWPYIIAADIGGSIYYRIEELPRFGIEWLVLTCVLPVLSAAGPIALLRRSKWIAREVRLASMCLRLLQTAGIVSFVSGAASIVCMAVITYSPSVQKLPQPPIFFLCDSMLGNYLGIMMVAPAALTWWLAKHKQFRIAYDEFREGVPSFVVAIIGGAIMTALLLDINRQSSSEDVQRVTSILMFVPPVWMTFRRGWGGAVVTTMLANLALQLTMRGIRDLDQLQTQALMGLVVSGMLLLGAAITESELRVGALSRQSGRHLQLARRNLSWGESRLRHSASIVERAFNLIQSYIDDTNLHMRPHGAESTALVRWNGAALARSDIRHTIANLHAHPLDTRGLRVALAYGPLAGALKDAGISYSIRVGPGVDYLPSDMQLMLYRVTYDAALHLARDNLAYRISTRICVYRTDQINVALLVKAWPGGGDLPRLPTPSMELEEVEDVAQSFAGKMKHKKRRRRPAIGVVLRDTRYGEAALEHSAGS